VSGTSSRASPVKRCRMVDHRDRHHDGRESRAGGAQDVDRAGAQRDGTFEGEWGRLGAADRGRLLARFGTVIASARGAACATRIAGHRQSRFEARARTSPRRSVYFEYYGGAPTSCTATTIPYLPGYAVQVLARPRSASPCHIIPWNYPTQMFRAVARGPSLAVGKRDGDQALRRCVAVDRRVGEVAPPRPAFRPGAINVVTGLGETAR